MRIAKPNFILNTLTMLLLLLLIGCSGDTDSGVTTKASDTGSATATLVWPEADETTATKAAAPAGVATIRVKVTGPDMSDMQKDFDATAGKGSITGIPAGTGRVFHFQGLDKTGQVTHQGGVKNVPITAGQNTKLGQITMSAVAPPPAKPGKVKLPKTGQTTCYDAAGTVINCTGTGQDGEIQAGEAWPNPRFTDNNNGTVTDNLTGLVWLKNANCTDTVGSIVNTYGDLNWANALTWSNSLASGACGLTDNSKAGDWRLPNIVELESLVDRSRYSPALPGGHPFTGVQSSYYWSSSNLAGSTYNAWYVNVNGGRVVSYDKSGINYVWPVRAGQ